jgi:hypothetical protein
MRWRGSEVCIIEEKFVVSLSEFKAHSKKKIMDEISKLFLFNVFHRLSRYLDQNATRRWAKKDYIVKNILKL